MTTINLYLARHGQTPANAASVLQGSSLNGELSEQGTRQAEALAQGLKDTPIDRIYASELRRAIQTAEKCQVFHPSAPLTTDIRLNEISWGVVDGVNIKQAKPTLDPIAEKWKSGDFNAKIENGESVQECQDRCVPAIVDILNESVEKGYKNVLLCLHGRLLRVIMATLVSRDLRTMNNFPHMNCSYHQVSVSVGGKVESLDDLRFEPVRIDVREHLAHLKQGTDLIAGL